MDRRKFLLNTIEASLAAYFTRLRAVRAAASTEAQCSLNPISAALKDYVPPAQPWTPSKSQNLEFGVLAWTTGKNRQVVSNPEIGKLSVKRTCRESDSRVRYSVRQTLGRDEILEGEYLCNRDSWNSLIEWEFEYRMNNQNRDLAALTRCREKGHLKGNQIQVNRDGGEEEITCEQPLACRWGMMDTLSSLDQEETCCERITVLQEPSGFRPEQQFRRHEEGTVGGAPFRAYLQTGWATLPTHWIVDLEGRPLFQTVFMVSWALKSIS